MPKHINVCEGDIAEKIKRCTNSECELPLKPMTAEFFTWDKTRKSFKPQCKQCIARLRKAERRAQGVPERIASTPERRATMKKDWERKFRKERKSAIIPAYDELDFTEKMCGNKECTVPVPQPVVNFTRDRYETDWLDSWCKVCRRPQGRRQQARRRVDDWAKALVGSSKGSAKRHNLPFDIDADWVQMKYVEQSGLCFWYGVPLKPSYTTKHPQKPSLERLKPEQGYTKENVVLACCAANLGRNICDVEAFQQFCNILRMIGQREE